MDTVYIAAAVPFFFLLIGIELLVTRRANEARYALPDSITNLSCGIGSQILGPFYVVFAVGTYTYAYEHLRFATVPPGSVWGFVLVMVATDLCYYAFHRASHRVNLFWAAHVVHHQSEEYNLSVALRQAWFEGPIQWVFYVPLAIVGFSPAMYLVAITFNTLYQFWIHTRAVGRLGPLEWVLNTPSHHRVHHGSNPKYIDKNYGGIFIVWDRLFGTFQAEEEEPVYGLVKPLASFNPLWANIAYIARMRDLARASTSFFEKATVWLRPPEWLPASQGGFAEIPEVSRATQQKYTSARSRWNGYLVVHLGVVVVLTTGYILVEASLAPSVRAGVAAWFVATLVAFGALLERKPWATGLEVARLVALPALGAWVALPTSFVVAAAGSGALVAAVSIAFVVRAPTVEARIGVPPSP